jgi:hypothetical protein
MKKLLPLSLLLLSLTAISSASAQTASTTLGTILSTKTCQAKYQAEVSAVFKLVDKNKALKKVAEIKTVRKEQDQNIKTVFDKIESKVEDADKKDIVAEHKEDILKTIDERRTKIDDLQESIQISKSDIERIVRNTVTGIVEEDSTKACPFTTANAKEIRKTNTIELRKLAENKSVLYQKQTKEIQQVFLQEVRSTLSTLQEELQK